MSGSWRAAGEQPDSSRCPVAPSPALLDRLRAARRSLRDGGAPAPALLTFRQPQHPGLNDGTIFPADQFPLGTPGLRVRRAAAERAPLRGTVRVVIVLVEFPDKKMTQTADHFRKLFFSTGELPNGSVKEYYTEVSKGLIEIDGEVVGPFKMPRKLADYAHGESGMGMVQPNAQALARDAATAADPKVDFGPYDNDGNGFVDAFIVIHAGRGAEETGLGSDIWSHKWTLDGSEIHADGTSIFGYLTVPEDSKIGVCAHELGHLLFGWPDLYDTDSSSSGLGSWCLMAGGSWNGTGDIPAHPSAWCKAQQGWVAVSNRKSTSTVAVKDVKTKPTVYRLWDKGTKGSEYFLVENRQRTGYDRDLPSDGLFVYHIDDSLDSNSDESHYKVGLVQADGKRHLELGSNQGDTGDPYPGERGQDDLLRLDDPEQQLLRRPGHPRGDPQHPGVGRLDERRVLGRLGWRWDDRPGAQEGLDGPGRGEAPACPGQPRVRPGSEGRHLRAEDRLGRPGVPGCPGPGGRRHRRAEDLGCDSRRRPVTRQRDGRPPGRPSDLEG